MSRLFKGRLIRKPRDKIVRELRSVIKGNETTAIHFSDDNSFRGDTEAQELCDIVRQVTSGNCLPWRCATRIDTLSNLSKETFERLAASGCKGVVVGIESGVDRVLELMRKRITVSQINRALNLLADNGLAKSLFFFLFDFTGETKKEAERTLALVRKTRVKLPYSDISLHVYFPGASDAGWLGADIPPALASRQSEIFAKYYAEHITNYRLAGKVMRMWRYYFAASKRREGRVGGARGYLRNVYQ